MVIPIKEFNGILIGHLSSEKVEYFTCNEKAGKYSITMTGVSGKEYTTWFSEECYCLQLYKDLKEVME